MLKKILIKWNKEKLKLHYQFKVLKVKLKI